MEPKEVRDKIYDHEKRITKMETAGKVLIAETSLLFPLIIYVVIRIAGH